jgi:hypothetical protein
MCVCVCVSVCVGWLTYTQRTCVVVVVSGFRLLFQTIHFFGTTLYLYGDDDTGTWISAIAKDFENHRRGSVVVDIVEVPYDQFLDDVVNEGP